MISNETKQKIINRVDIIDIVGTYVKLKKRGANYLGLCPFHNEKTPSFTVSPTKEIYKCFGCGKSGNSINFLMDMEKYSFVEALRFLANKYNIEIEETETSPEMRRLHQTADSLYILNKYAQEFFSNSLLHTEEGTDVALSYLQERGFRTDIIKKFQLGYSPQQRDAFAQTALKNQFSPELLQKSGLVVLRDQQPVDNYRGRIIFPVHNPSGRILGFGARLIKNNDKAPKYINTPENELYVKSKILYGVNFARMAIDKADECLLVEGYTDVVSLHQAGIENVVASGGTSLTSDQLHIIKKYSNNLTILYDGDSAGIKAAMRGLDLALEQGLNVMLVLIPDKEDPDSYVNKLGAAEFQKFIQNNKQDFILFQLNQYLNEAGQDKMKRLHVVNQIAETISKIDNTENFTLRQDYIRQVSQLLNIEEDGLNNLVNNIIRTKVAKDFNLKKQAENNAVNLENSELENTGDVEILLNKDEKSERAVLRVLLSYGLEKWSETETVAEYIFSQVGVSASECSIENPELYNIYNMYYDWYQKGMEPTEKNFLYLEDSNLTHLVIQLLESNTEISPRWNEIYEGKLPDQSELYRDDIISSLCYLQLRKIKKTIVENQNLLQNAKNAQEQIMALKTHKELKQMEMELIKQLGTVIVKI